MRDEDKSREQLLTELREIRQRLKGQEAGALSDQAESDRTRDRLTAALGQSAMDLKASRAETAAGKEVLAESQESLRISEQDLAAFHERYNILGDLIPFGIWTADGKGNITFLSDAFLEMSGITSAETGRLEWVDQLARPVVRTAISEWSSALHQRDIWEREFTAVSEAGKKYDILIRGVPVLNDKENILSWLGINLDISQRKRAEENLRRHKEELEELVHERSVELARSEHLYRSIAANLPYATVFIIDADLRYLLAEGSGLRDAGIVPADLEGKTIYEALPKELAETYEPFYRSALGGDSVSMEHAVHGRHYLSHIVPIHENGGGILTALAVSYDITERKRAEDLLKQQTAETEEKARILETILEYFPDGMAITGGPPDFRLMAVSRSGLEMTGKNPEKLVNLTTGEHQVAWGLWLPDGTTRPAREQMPLYRASRLGEVTRYAELIMESSDGQKFPVLISAAPIRDKSGNIVGAINTWRDITELRDKESALRNLAVTLESRVRERTLELEQASRAKDQFLANMSHEIRTPMAGVLGLTEILLHQELPSKVHGDLAMIRSSAESVMTLLDDMFDLSRISQGKTDFYPTEFDLRAMVRDTLGPFDFKVRSKDLDFSVSIDESVPSQVFCDKDRLAQVLKNLVSNAIKFTERGFVRVHVTAEKNDEDTLRLNFTVSDSGLGIPKSKQNEIFSAFTQLDPSYSKKFAGIGLGLAISKSLVEGMGGEITVESTRGKGTILRFYVTCGITTEEQKTTTPSITLQDLPPMTILLAEDNPVNRLFLRRELVNAGHNVGEAEDGRHALAKLEDTHFDLVLMDIQMPEMDGVEATRRIRSGKHGRADIPIIALTAYAMKGDREKFLDNDMDGYVTKPVNFGELARTIAEVCGLAVT